MVKEFVEFANCPSEFFTITFHCPTATPVRLTVVTIWFGTVTAGEDKGIISGCPVLFR